MKVEQTDELINAIIDILRERRKAAGLSHHTLAERTGLTRPTISFIESRRYQSPTLHSCIRLAAGLEIEFSELVLLAEKQLKK